MPKTTVDVFQDSNGDVLLVDWLKGLEKKAPRVHKKSLERIERLAVEGYELGMPLAKPLGDGIYELRITNQPTCYRILYFFNGKDDKGDKDVVILSHGLVKEQEVPPGDITKAKERRKLVKSDSKKYTASFS